jgi:translation initiation factor 3 subunit B
MESPPEIDPLAIAQELFPDQPPGFPVDLEDFDLRDVRLPEGEEFGIRSDEDDGDEEDVATETGFGSVIGERYFCSGREGKHARRWSHSLIACWEFLSVVSNLPTVAPEKYDKLTGVIKKIYSQIGDIREGQSEWRPGS